MCVTKDKYELPLCVADTQEELAKMLGICPSVIYRALSNAKKGSKSKYIAVEVEESVEL